MNERDAGRFLTEIETRLEPLDRAILLAEWRLASGHSRIGAAAGQERRHLLLSAPGLLETIRRYRSAGFGGMLERRLGLLERAALDSRIEQDPEIVRLRGRLQARVAAFRPQWRGRRVRRIVVREAFRTGANREERRRAYYAEDPLYRGVEGALERLVALRNDKAREFGFRSYPEYRLSFDRLSVAGIERLMEGALRHASTEARRRREAFEDRTGERGWFPWDTSYAEHLAMGLPDRAFPARTMLSSVTRAVRAWGVPPSALRFRVDRHDIPSGGLCLAPDPPRDVRIVIHPGRGGWVEHMVLFHEVGHAVHSASIRESTHLLRWHEGLPGFGGFHEGIGEFFTLIAESEAWLGQRGDLSRQDIAEFRSVALRSPLWRVAHLVEWIRTELDLYLRPGRDPVQRSHAFQRRLFGFDEFAPRSFADSFYIEAPVYATSYLIAELLRPLLCEAVLEEVGGETWPNRRIGPWLIDRWFRGGSSFDWLPRVQEVTGRPFGTRAFNAWVG